MSVGKTLTLGISAAAAIAVSVLIALLLVADHPTAIRGAVMAANADPMKELPIAGAEVEVRGVPASAPVRSDASGLFTIPLTWRIRVGQRIEVHVSHAGYQPLDLRYTGVNQLYVARLTPVTVPHALETPIANVVANYSVRTTTVVNIGSALKTFEVVNTGNQPCKGRKPCSPDGKWKAAIGSAAIDAGPGNEFHNARVSCIAGPCPFARIEDDVSHAPPSRIVRASALDWSDTVTFLLEAEVYRHIANDVLRNSYPIIFDRALTFTLPPGAEQLSIQAEIDGTPIVFPLGPLLHLSWADCQLLVNKDQTKVCRCELKPGFYFAGEVSARRDPHSGV
jgi:hypothetical protein